MLLLWRLIVTICPIHYWWSITPSEVSFKLYSSDFVEDLPVDLILAWVEALEQFFLAYVRVYFSGLTTAQYVLVRDKVPMAVAESETLIWPEVKSVDEF